MPYKFNIFTGTLDYYNSSSSGGITGPVTSTDKAITRWNGTAGDVVQDSKAIVQDGGAIEAQAFLTNRVIDELVQIRTNYTMLASNIEINDGELIIDQDGELVII